MSSLWLAVVTVFWSRPAVQSNICHQVGGGGRGARGLRDSFPLHAGSEFSPFWPSQPWCAWPSSWRCNPASVKWHRSRIPIGRHRIDRQRGREGNSGASHLSLFNRPRRRAESDRGRAGGGRRPDRGRALRGHRSVAAARRSRLRHTARVRLYRRGGQVYGPVTPLPFTMAKRSSQTASRHFAHAVGTCCPTRRSSPSRSTSLTLAPSNSSTTLAMGDCLTRYS